MVLPLMKSAVLIWQESLALHIRRHTQKQLGRSTELLEETLLRLTSLGELVKHVLREEHEALTAGAATVAAV